MIHFMMENEVDDNYFSKLGDTKFRHREQARCMRRNKKYNLFIDKDITLRNERMNDLYVTTVGVLVIYVFMCCWSFWPVLNFYFTIWRVYQFGFLIDRILLTVLCLYYMGRMYQDLYGHIDALYVFLLNYRK